MRLIKGGKRCIALVAIVCCYTWWLIQRKSLNEHVSVIEMEQDLDRHSSFVNVKLTNYLFAEKHLPQADGKPTPDSTKWSSNLALDRSGNKISANKISTNKKDQISSTFEHSSWKFGNDIQLRPMRIYEWNETVVQQGILPLVDKLNLDSSKPRIIFNRVGKCGSRSVLDIFRILAERNQFNMIESLVYTQKILPPRKEEMMAHVLSQLKAPYLFQRHMYHINFTYYGLQSPSYINIIRDPIARFTSQYYYKRFGDGFQERTWTFNGTENERYQTINECVLRDKYECSERKTFYIVPFFCGNDPRCKTPTEWTLKRAMENVRKDFKVIGLLEDLHSMFIVLEKMWPEVFNGCVHLLEHPSESQQQNRTAALTKAKEKPSPKVIAILKDQMNLEYRFYDFVKSRFHVLKKRLGIGVKHR